VHLGYAFNVPDGVMRMDIPWRSSVRRSTRSPARARIGSPWGAGSTCRTRSVALLGDARRAHGAGGRDHRRSDWPDPNPDDWLAKLAPSQTLYSMVMNNHWWTTTRPIRMARRRSAIGVLPHQQYDQAAAQRSASSAANRLVAAAARGAAPDDRPLLELDTPKVLVASVKPSEDHKALIVAYSDAGGQPAKAALRWGRSPPKAVWISNLAEERVAGASGAVDVPA